MPAKIFSATSICIMSFLGFDAVSTLAEEVEGGDRRVVGRAIIAVLVLSAAFFVGVTWVLGDLLPGIAIKDPAAAVYELAALGHRPLDGGGAGVGLRGGRRPVECAADAGRGGARGICHGPRPSAAAAGWRASIRAITRPMSACW